MVVSSLNRVIETIGDVPIDWLQIAKSGANSFKVKTNYRQTTDRVDSWRTIIETGTLRFPSLFEKRNDENLWCCLSARLSADQ